ncbi:MAG: nitronate monooxygenase [Dehalococcoidia bacterium]|nr:nitronate monooxygenase [Dehalococcoidia bacterium]
MRELPRTPICDLLGIRYPIVQAGMGAPKGGPTTPGLVAAVSEAGGLGCLGAMGFSPDELRAAIMDIRQRTDRPFGVDLILPTRLPVGYESRDAARDAISREHPAHQAFREDLAGHYALPDAKMADSEVISPAQITAQIDVVLEENVPVFVAGLGDPAQVAEEAHRRGIIVMGLAGSVRNAARQKAAGVDVVIAQGTEAGGHTGAIGTMALVPQVVDAVGPLPVLAAGGIGDGRGLIAALALGATGVWCGTAFLFAEESGLPEVQREQLRRGMPDDFVVSTSYTGKPARQYKNEVVTSWSESGLPSLGMPLQTVLMDDFVAAAQAAGRFELTSNPGGQIAGMLNEIVPAAEIARRIVQGAEAELDRLDRLSAGLATKPRLASPAAAPPGS